MNGEFYLFLIGESSLNFMALSLSFNLLLELLCLILRYQKLLLIELSLSCNSNCFRSSSAFFCKYGSNKRSTFEFYIVLSRISLKRCCFGFKGCKDTRTLPTWPTLLSIWRCDRTRPRSTDCVSLTFDSDISCWIDGERRCFKLGFYEKLDIILSLIMFLLLSFGLS